MDMAAAVSAAVRARAWLARHGRLCIVWDLDDCLLKSEHLTDERDDALNTTVVEVGGGLPWQCPWMEHVDDDLMRFRTVLRPGVRAVLWLLLPYARHFVFTSATRGYMTNVLQLVDPRGDLLEPGDGTRFSASDFARGQLRREGKRVVALPAVRRLAGARAGGEGEGEGGGAGAGAGAGAGEGEGEGARAGGGAPTLLRAVLVDDQPKYHAAQPANGLLVPPFGSGAVLF
eukprot:g7946.t1